MVPSGACMSVSARDTGARDCHVLAAAPHAPLRHASPGTLPLTRCRLLQPSSHPWGLARTNWGAKRGQTRLSPPCFLLSQHPKASRAVGWGCVLRDQDLRIGAPNTYLDAAISDFCRAMAAAL